MTIEQHTDAGPVAELEAGTDALVRPVDPLMCTSANAASASAPILDRACDGGFRYANYGGACPTADAGQCFALPDNATIGYGEVCCERSACTRLYLPKDVNCIMLTDALTADAGSDAKADAAHFIGFECPPDMLPPGDCLRYGPVPSRDFCCR